jgi:hypothetical protein
MAFVSPAFEQDNESFHLLIFLYVLLYKKIISPGKTLSIIFGEITTGIRKRCFKD